MVGDNAPSESTPSQQATPERRPDPPPYRPDKDLIGYVEKGQKPPAPPPPATEKH